MPGCRQTWVKMGVLMKLKYCLLLSTNLANFLTTRACLSANKDDYRYFQITKLMKLILIISCYQLNSAKF